MLAIAFRFPAGRYHATPWGRHVNEADVEWPPSPWRILRAFIAVWHRKADQREYPREALESLIGRLAGCLPVYQLPPAVHSHVRHYMPSREGSKEKKILIFDAFARLSSQEDLVVAWPDLELETKEERLIDELLTGIGYLGRAESWVDGRRLPRWQGSANCMPSESAKIGENGEMGETVPLLCPLSPSAYLDHSERQLNASHDSKGKGRGKTRKQTLTGPGSWLSAVSAETSELQSFGWSSPPAAQRIWYNRPADALMAPIKKVAAHQRNPKLSVTTLRFALYGKPLPMLEDAVRFGELARMAVMRVVEKHCGMVSPLISGHELPGNNRHEHAFFLPEPDQRGRIDHLLIHAPGGLDKDTLRAVQGLKKLYRRDGTEWEVWFEGAGDVQAFIGKSACVAQCSIWRSITPYLHPWHRKKKFGITEQIRKECSLRGLAEPTAVAVLPEVIIGGRPRSPVHFHRFRSKQGLVQPDTHGSFLELVFPEMVSGPLAFGFGCHYGLGLFLPVRGSSSGVEE